MRRYYSSFPSLNANLFFIIFWQTIMKVYELDAGANTWPNSIKGQITNSVTLQNYSRTCAGYLVEHNINLSQEFKLWQSGKFNNKNLVILQMQKPIVPAHNLISWGILIKNQHPISWQKKKISRYQVILSINTFKGCGIKVPRLKKSS